MLVGERIKHKRKERHLTQKELGEKLGVSNTMIAAWELGNRTPKASTVRKIAAALNCNESELISINTPVVTNTNQPIFLDKPPLNHIHHCWQGRCPSGEKVCCFECGDRTCRDRCDDIECHKSLYWRGHDEDV